MDKSNLYTTIPAPSREKKPGQLSDEQLKQYFEEVCTVTDILCRFLSLYITH